MPQESSPTRVSGMNIRTFEYEGTTYYLTQPLKLGSYRDEVAFVLAMRHDPMEFGLRCVARLPEHRHAAVWTGCATANMLGFPTEEEWAAYSNSLYQKAHMLWVCLDPRHKIDPESKQPFNVVEGIQRCVELMHGLHMTTDPKNPPSSLAESVLIKIGIVSQQAEIKNSCGVAPAPETTPDPGQLSDILSTKDGQQSTNSSEKSTE